MAVSGVSAEWKNENFTTLRVTVPEGGKYRISYSAVNKSSGNSSFVPKFTVPTDSSSQKVVNGLSPDCFYTLNVEAVLSETTYKVNDSVGIGERMHTVPCMLTLQNQDRQQVVQLHSIFAQL